MLKALLSALALVLIFILAIFFFISRVSTNVGKNSKELKTRLEAIQAPIYTPLGIATAILKFFLSIFT
jgi:preprotein translocase subunit YajC